jgi:hypothetical protein
MVGLSHRPTFLAIGFMLVYIVAAVIPINLPDTAVGEALTWLLWATDTLRDVTLFIGTFLLVVGSYTSISLYFVCSTRQAANILWSYAMDGPIMASSGTMAISTDVGT